MLTFTSGLRKLKFDRELYQSVISEAIVALVYDAAKAWLDAVLHSVNGAFPVYTGMAISSLRPIHAHLKQGPGQEAVVPVSFRPVARVKGKTPALGEAAGRDFKIQVFKNQYGVHKVEFDWSSAVEHFEYNEYNPPPPGFHLKNPGPWNTMLAGEQAFQRYIEEHVNDRIGEVLKRYEFIVEDK